MIGACYLFDVSAAGAATLAAAGPKAADAATFLAADAMLAATRVRLNFDISQFPPRNAQRFINMLLPEMHNPNH